MKRPDSETLVSEATSENGDGGSFDGFAMDQKLFVCIVAAFVSCLLLGDVIGGKIIRTPLGPISVGIIPFPVTFLLTDIVNDFYGRRGARFLTLVGFGAALLAWLVLQISNVLQADVTTYYTQAEFQKIFGGSAVLFLASMVAYLIGQFLDINVFQFWKALTRSKHLWLRATGSTLLSQIVDTVAINVLFNGYTAYGDPNSPLALMAKSEGQGAVWTWIFAKIGREYGIKVCVAIGLTPVVYALHHAIVEWLGLRAASHEARK